MRGWSLQLWSLNVPELTEWKFRGQQQQRVLSGAVPPAPRSRLMLHKYLRPRFAWGAPWRKHRGEGGEHLQRQQGWHRRRLLTHQHPWGPPGGPAKGLRMLLGSSAQQRQLSSQLADSGIRDSRFARIPFSVTAGSRQAARPHLPQAAKSRPAPGATLDLPRLSASLSRLPASAPLPRAPGSALPGARTRAATTDKPHALGWLQGPDTRT